jgi:hypothetical protein
MHVTFDQSRTSFSGLEVSWVQQINLALYLQCDHQEAEEIAQTYGYPINKCWDVSTLQNFAGIFCNVNTFKEDIIVVLCVQCNINEANVSLGQGL